MKTIFITYQDGQGQYDQNYNQITEWNSKYCSWVVLPEYEEAYNNGEIDWWGEDNDFPAGETMKELQEQYPDADSWPYIHVQWFWTTEGYIKTFHERPKYEHQLRYGNCWEYLNYTKEEAIEKTGRYCDFHKNAYRTVVEYNGEVIFDGKLEDGNS